MGPQTRWPSPALSTGSLATVGGSYTRERVESTRPKGRRRERASVVSSLRDLLCRRLPRYTEFFKTRVEARTMLKRGVLEDEPDWRDVLYIEPVELVTGGLNQRATHPTSAAIYR